MAFRDAKAAEQMIREDLQQLREQLGSVRTKIVTLQQHEQQLVLALEKWESVLEDDD